MYVYLYVYFKHIRVKTWGGGGRKWEQGWGIKLKNKIREAPARNKDVNCEKNMVIRLAALSQKRKKGCQEGREEWQEGKGPSVEEL